ncbi:MAG: glycyl-radical enzyme activating protein [Spirochaetes bacterium]|nr:glycyl-radical enzyme activating protein [Spirochaetota bacterium]
MSETGMVLSVLRASFNDGPGIRTTVFLKGCPLRCRWCHNPESQSPRMEIAFLENRCSRCGACVSACPNHCHALNASGHTVDRTACTACGACANACGNGALSIKGKAADVDEIMRDVVKDIPYYQSSGGGITLSGGEPLMQPDLAAEILRRAKAEGIHTTVETCGLASRNVFERIAPLTDLFLFDLKGMNDDLHRQHTGVSNRMIHENAKWLCESGANVMFRLPIIPGLNDRDADLAALGAFICSLPGEHAFEIMPYHAMGTDKAAQIGQAYTCEARVPAPADIERCENQLKAAVR